MWPGASVCGWYFSHPQSQYFVVGRLGRDQVADYAERKGWTLDRGGALALPEPRLRPGGLSVADYAAVLWDMDGTLVDTEPYWIETEYALAEKHGGTWSDEHALNLVGNDLLDSGRYIREHMGIDLEPDQIVEELLDGVVARVEQEVPWCPGAVELLAALGAADVPCALVTMSYRRFVAPVLAALPPETFRTIVTGDAGQPGQAAPRAVPHRRPAARRRPGRLPGHRGLQHRCPVRGGRRVHGAGRAEPRAGAAGGAAGLPGHAGRHASGQPAGARPLPAASGEASRRAGHPARAAASAGCGPTWPRCAGRRVGAPRAVARRRA